MNEPKNNETILKDFYALVAGTVSRIRGHCGYDKYVSVTFQLNGSGEDRINYVIYHDNFAQAEASTLEEAEAAVIKHMQKETVAAQIQKLRDEAARLEASLIPVEKAT